jgi:hypothetical protein
MVPRLGQGKYDVLIENEAGDVVTVMKGLSGEEVRAKAETYGWR